MVDEACLPVIAYFPWTLDYTPFMLGSCLSVLTFLIAYVYIDYDFWYNDLRFISSEKGSLLTSIGFNQKHGLRLTHNKY